MGLTGLENATFVVEKLNLPVSPEKYYALTREKITKLFPTAKLTPGINVICHYQIFYIIIFFFSTRYRRNL